MYTLTCTNCGKEFQATYKRVKVCPACKRGVCEVCGKEFIRDWPYDQRACSEKCRHIIRTDPIYHGDRQERKKAHMLEKYGVDNVAKLPEVREKLRQRTLSKECQQKAKQTCLERYGTDHYSKTPEFKEKMAALRASQGLEDS